MFLRCICDGGAAKNFRNAFRTIQNAFVIAPAIGRQIIAYDQ
jgi:hypothetical protein